MIRITIIALAMLALISPAEARRHHHAHRVIHYDPGCNVIFPCDFSVASTPVQVRETRGRYIARQMGIGGPVVRHVERKVSIRPERPHRLVSRQTVPSYTRTAGEVIGGRPAGCPHAFCGCGASLHLFGRIIPSLNLAANWLRFPRAIPAPRMAAARNHHVMVLESHVRGDIWMVHDSNSGRGLTRLHARSISGYTIVNPSGAG